MPNIATPAPIDSKEMARLIEENLSAKSTDFAKAVQDFDGVEDFSVAGASSK